jgi:transcriptional regulator with XRE-family HTH domain
MPLFDNEELREQFRDKEYREAYADDTLSAYIAAQIRSIREQRTITQEELADLIGTKQAGVSRIENVNYSNWSLRTLRRIAYAFGCRLHVSIETFGSLLDEGASFSRQALERPKFEDDPVFAGDKIKTPKALRRPFDSCWTRLPDDEAQPSSGAPSLVAPTPPAGTSKPLEVLQDHATQKRGEVIDLADYMGNLRQRQNKNFLEAPQEYRTAGVRR